MSHLHVHVPQSPFPILPGRSLINCRDDQHGSPRFHTILTKGRGSKISAKIALCDQLQCVAPRLVFVNPLLKTFHISGNQIELKGIKSPRRGGGSFFVGTIYTLSRPKKLGNFIEGQRFSRKRPFRFALVKGFFQRDRPIRPRLWKAHVLQCLQQRDPALLTPREQKKRRQPEEVQ